MNRIIMCMNCGYYVDIADEYVDEVNYELISYVMNEVMEL